jgi:hypothetical protein
MEVQPGPAGAGRGQNLVPLTAVLCILFPQVRKVQQIWSLMFRSMQEASKTVF